MTADAFFLFIITALLLIYALLIQYYNLLFRRLSQFTFPENYNHVNTFSIIIPARNEELNIEKCINSILENNYPVTLFEIIIVDDFSTDKTAAIVQEMQALHPNIKLLLLKDVLQTTINSYKKKSIESGIQISSNGWIITTDADCIVSKNWLQYFDACIQKHDPVFIAAPVMLTSNGSMLSIFQKLDFISLQGITAASVSAGFHSMCNGANLAYKKSAFREVDGFAGIDSLASGDDMLLMHKMFQKFPGRLQYLFSSEVIVTTSPMTSLADFLSQRIRWASKATAYNDTRIFVVLLLVYILNCSLFVLLLASLLNPFLFAYFIVFVLLKAMVEMPFMYAIADFFSSRKLLWWFIPLQPLHIMYTVISGLFSKFGKYNWKGRRVQ